MHVMVILLIAAAAVRMYAQVAPEVDILVARMQRYLVNYETQLSTVVADERYRQSETRPLEGRDSLESGIGRFTTRTLESEVAFLRLPGNREWYGVRDVRRVNGKSVAAKGPRLLDAMKAPAVEREPLVKAIVRASSAHNLGPIRTTNMPTVPLELLHPRHHARFMFRSGGAATISSTSTRELRFQEQMTPTLVQDIAGRPLRAVGSAWVEAATGRLWRVVLRLENARPPVAGGQVGGNELRVDFAHDATLDLMVPRELREDLAAQGSGRVQGRATYSNFRRFTTSARILPPP
jgi:hypothetical protein